MITREELQKAAKSAKLFIEKEQIEDFTRKINDVLSFCDTMEEAEYDDEDFKGLNDMPDTYVKLKSINDV